MKKSRRGVVAKLRELWKSHRSRQDRRGRRPTLRFESLEARLALAVTHNPGDHIHPTLSIMIDGVQMQIPSDIGITATRHFNPHTHDATGTLHIGEGLATGIDPEGSTVRFTTLKDFFDVWRTTGDGTTTSNPNALFDSTHLMDRVANATHVVRMYVNGEPNTQFENYIPEDSDSIVLSYEPASVAGAPTFAPIKDVHVLAGSPLFVPLDGFDPQNQNLTYTVTSGNSALVAGTIPTGNPSMKVTVANFGDMVFQLNQDLAPRPVNRVVTLANQGFYNGIKFHRILNNFVIQGGDPTGTGTSGSSLGNFDDQFSTDLQHNSPGALSFAKSSDDTNNSQFFITETQNEIQFVTLTGTPSSGTFTLSYRGQTTAPINFDAANIAATTANIQTALSNLSKIGVGNVVVTNSPQGGETRRWSVEFVAALGKQEISNLTGSGAGLTGGTSPSVSVLEGQKFASRHLDFNHSVFGHLIEGENIRELISNVSTDANGKPATDVVMSSVTIFNDTENGVLMLKAPEGVSGETTVTVTVRDSDNNAYSRTFRVFVDPDPSNGGPFLNDVSTSIRTTVNTPVNVTLTSQDPEGNAVTYSAIKADANTTTVSANATTGVVSITPPNNFVGVLKVQGSVAAAVGVPNDTGDKSDIQVFNVTVAPAAPTAVDLLAVSDSGIKSDDNITNVANGLQFLITGVTSGATVQLREGQTVIGTAVATGTSVTITTTAALTDGVHSLTAVQTVSSVTSDPSAALSIKVDTTAPVVFTSSPPTQATTGQLLTYNAVHPEEGTTDFKYSLVTPPAGATIDANSGVVTWTPGVAQTGTQTFGINATDAAGNIRTQTVSVNVVSAKRIEFRLAVTNASGQPISTLQVGDNFELRVFAKDTQSTGVFAAFMDVTFDSAKAIVTGAIDRANSQYNNSTSGTTSTAGLIDEAGGIIPSLTPVGGGEFLVMKVPLRATGSGTLEFISDPPDQLPGHNILVFGTNTAVASADINFGTASVIVQSAIGANTDTLNANEDTTNNTLNVLINDNKPVGFVGDLLITNVGTTNHGGVVTIAGDGKSLIYSPAPNFAGTETFSYTVAAGNDTTTANVNVIVTNVNDSPTAVNDSTATHSSFSVAEDAPNNVLDVLRNDTDIDPNDTLRVTLIGARSNNGTATIGPNGSHIVYTPAPNFVGSETIVYTISDSAGFTATATATVTVNAVNDPPIALNDSFTVSEDTTDNSLTVLANDSNVEAGETLTITAVGTTNNATITIAAGGGALKYTPKPNFQGTDTFTYTVGDGNSTATGTVTMTVTNVNDPPDAVSDSGFSTLKNSGPQVLQVLPNDTFLPDPTETLTIQSVSTGSNGGTITIAGDAKSISYKPATNFVGNETFTYTISDGHGGTDTATVTVNVLNFRPSSLAGSVFQDADNDGVMDSGEAPIGGVKVTITGNSSVDNTTTNQSIFTAADGSYSFLNLAPGNYRLKQEQPAFMLDGIDLPGSQGGAVAANDEIAITLSENTVGVRNNFAERGRAPQFVDIRDFIVSRPRNFVLAALGSSGNSSWSSNGPGWDLLRVTNVQPVANNQLQITAQPTTPNASTLRAFVPANDTSHVQFVGQVGNDQLVRLVGTAAAFNFQPIAVGAGEGESSATDTPLNNNTTVAALGLPPSGIQPSTSVADIVVGPARSFAPPAANSILVDAVFALPSELDSHDESDSFIVSHDHGDHDHGAVDEALTDEMLLGH